MVLNHWIARDRDGSFFLFDGEPEPLFYEGSMMWAERDEESCTPIQGISEFLDEIVPPGTAVEIIFGKRKKM